eukprot:Amastigsp_a843944_148.p2 type:complete len:238 gc:universal Amastigsp_a843944_148:366-1079(+)
MRGLRTRDADVTIVLAVGPRDEPHHCFCCSEHRGRRGERGAAVAQPRRRRRNRVHRRAPAGAGVEGLLGHLERERGGDLDLLDACVELELREPELGVVHGVVRLEVCLLCTLVRAAGGRAPERLLIRVGAAVDLHHRGVLAAMRASFEGARERRAHAGPLAAPFELLVVKRLARFALGGTRAPRATTSVFGVHETETRKQRRKTKRRKRRPTEDRSTQKSRGQNQMKSKALVRTGTS